MMGRQQPAGEARAAGGGVIGTGSALPRRLVHNPEIAELTGVPDGWIERQLGVHQRHFAAEDETHLDFALSAASAALGAAGLSPCELGAVVVATSTARLRVPPVAAELQGALRAGCAVAFDVNAGGAGFLTALEIGRGLLTSQPHRRYALVAAVDTFSRYADPADRRTYAAVGDGAGAVVLSGGCAEETVSTGHGTDGRLARYITLRGPGSGRPECGGANSADGGGTSGGGTSGDPGSPGDGAAGPWLRAAGRDVAALMRQRFPELVRDAVAEAGVGLDGVDHVVAQQACPRLLEELARLAGIAPEKLVVTGDRVGDTGAASIPVGLDTAVRQGRIRPGDTVLMVEFGAGMSWARTLLRWPSTYAPVAAARRRAEPPQARRAPPLDTGRPDTARPDTGKGECPQ